MQHTSERLVHDCNNRTPCSLGWIYGGWAFIAPTGVFCRADMFAAVLSDLHSNCWAVGRLCPCHAGGYVSREKARHAGRLRGGEHAAQHSPANDPGCSSVQI